MRKENKTKILEKKRKRNGVDKDSKLRAVGPQLSSRGHRCMPAQTPSQRLSTPYYFRDHRINLERRVTGGKRYANVWSFQDLKQYRKWENGDMGWLRVSFCINLSTMLECKGRDCDWHTDHLIVGFRPPRVFCPPFHRIVLYRTERAHGDQGV